MIHTCQLRSLEKPCTSWLPCHPSKRHCPFMIFSSSKEKKKFFIPNLIVKIYKYLLLQSISLQFCQDLAPSTTPTSFVFCFFLSLPASLPAPSLLVYTHTVTLYCCLQTIFTQLPYCPPTAHCRAKHAYCFTLSLIPSSLFPPSIKLLQRIYWPGLFPHSTLSNPVQHSCIPTIYKNPFLQRSS